MGTILRAKTLNIRVSSDVLIPSIQPVRHCLMRWDAKMNITPHTSTIRMRTFFNSEPVCTCVRMYVESGAELTKSSVSALHVHDV